MMSIQESTSKTASYSEVSETQFVKELEQILRRVRDESAHYAVLGQNDRLPAWILVPEKVFWQLVDRMGPEYGWPANVSASDIRCVDDLVEQQWTYLRRSGQFPPGWQVPAGRHPFILLQDKVAAVAITPEEYSFLAKGVWPDG